MCGFTECGIVHFAICALRNAITRDCIQFQLLQHLFQCIAHNHHCELMNTEIADIIGFFPLVFRYFRFVEYRRRFRCQFVQISDIGSVFRLTDPWLVEAAIYSDLLKVWEEWTSVSLYESNFVTPSEMADEILPFQYSSWLPGVEIIAPNFYHAMISAATVRTFLG